MLNLSKIGRPLCKIVGGKYDKNIVSVSDKTPNDDEPVAAQEFKGLKIPNNSVFQQVVNTKTEREIIYCTGCSGSGKSTYCRKYLEQYKKTYKDNDIYLFSSLPHDESIDSVKPKRIRLDDSLISDPIPIESFENSCVIFDDIDVISDKNIRKAVYALLNKILEIGRHLKTTALVTAHLPTNGLDTRRILNESMFVVYFSHSANKKIRYLLENYVGVDRAQIDRFRRMNTRWVCISRNFPQIYITEHECGLLSEVDV
jgi:energy-coupling factor transporter ATP-binding protein EcfA2